MTDHIMRLREESARRRAETAEAALSRALGEAERFKLERDQAVVSFTEAADTVQRLTARAEAAEQREAEKDKRIAALTERRFPIQGGPSIPWSVIAPYDQQAVKNHSQDLETLARRGGLSPCEAMAVLDNRPWHHFTDAEDAAALVRLRALASPSTPSRCVYCQGTEAEHPTFGQFACDTFTTPNPAPSPTQEPQP